MVHLIHPIPLNFAAIKLSCIQDSMLFQVMFRESNLCGVIVKATINLKLSNIINSFSFDETLRNRLNIKFIEGHGILFVFIDIIPHPLPSLNKIWHFEMGWSILDNSYINWSQIIIWILLAILKDVLINITYHSTNI